MIITIVLFGSGNIALGLVLKLSTESVKDLMIIAREESDTWRKYKHFQVLEVNCNGISNNVLIVKNMSLEEARSEAKKRRLGITNIVINVCNVKNRERLFSETDEVVVSVGQQGLEEIMGFTEKYKTHSKRIVFLENDLSQIFRLEENLKNDSVRIIPCMLDCIVIGTRHKANTIYIDMESRGTILINSTSDFLKFDKGLISVEKSINMVYFPDRKEFLSEWERKKIAVNAYHYYSAIICMLNHSKSIDDLYSTSNFNESDETLVDALIAAMAAVWSIEHFGLINSPKNMDEAICEFVDYYKIAKERIGSKDDSLMRILKTNDNAAFCKKSSNYLNSCNFNLINYLDDQYLNRVAVAFGLSRLSKRIVFNIIKTLNLDVSDRMKLVI